MPQMREHERSRQTEARAAGVAGFVFVRRAGELMVKGRLLGSVFRAVGPVVGNILGLALGCAFLAPVVLIWREYGAYYVSRFIMIPLEFVGIFCAFISLLAVLGCGFKMIRGVAGPILFVSTMVWFSALWVFCLILLRTVSRLAVAFGLFMGGVGVIPLAVIEALWAKGWRYAALIVASVLVILAVMGLAALIMARAERDQTALR
jgi:hypothetical protein